MEPIASNFMATHQIKKTETMSNLNLPQGWSVETHMGEDVHFLIPEDQTTNQGQENLNQRQGWVPRGEVVSIHGREIPGMVYVGKPPISTKYGKQKCKTYIDPSLPVAKFRYGDDESPTPTAWLRYSKIPPERRAGYLDWLAAGAKETMCCQDYVLLYFYGLERRFFVDQSSPDEMKEIFEEVCRIDRLFMSHRRYHMHYMNSFIAFATAVIKDLDDIEPIFDVYALELPFLVKFVISNYIAKDVGLTADWLLSWFLCHPERKLRTACRRCFKEFMELFKIRFNEQFPDGLKFKKSTYQYQDIYRATSAEFTVSVHPMVNGKPVSDIRAYGKPREVAKELADEIAKELDMLSRYLGRDPEGRGSLKAHGLLPADLRQIFKPRQVEQAKAWAEDIVQQGELIDILDVALYFEEDPSINPNKREVIGFADTLAYIGFGLAPDPRFELRPAGFGEPYILFELGDPIYKLEGASRNYTSALVELVLALFVAKDGGTITNLEQNNLADQIHSAASLSDHEQRRLHANLIWFQAFPPDMPLLRRTLKETDSEQQFGIRSTLVAVAHVSGIVKPETIATIEKIYRLLGLDTNLVYSDIHAGEVCDTPVSTHVDAAQLGKPSKVGSDKRPKQNKKLDAKRVASIQQDTERVSATLANIFSLEDDEKTTDTGPPPILTGLDEKHTALVREIITRKHWSYDTFNDLAARHGLMAAGALETINEWSFGIYNEALIEEYEGYDVSLGIADELAKEFATEKN